MRTRTFLPRPEYPRPDRQRGFVQGVDWLNLNGAWEFRFDPERVGLAEKWFVPSARQWPDQIIVPFCWESLAAWGEADAAGNDNFFRRAFIGIRSTLTAPITAVRRVTRWVGTAARSGYRKKKHGETDQNAADIPSALQPVFLLSRDVDHGFCQLG